MSAEWFDLGQPQQQQQGDAFGGIWEDADAGWGFDGVDAGYDAPADWYATLRVCHTQSGV